MLVGVEPLGARLHLLAALHAEPAPVLHPLGVGGVQVLEIRLHDLRLGIADSRRDIVRAGRQIDGLGGRPGVVVALDLVWDVAFAEQFPGMPHGIPQSFDDDVHVLVGADSVTDRIVAARIQHDFEVHPVRIAVLGAVVKLGGPAIVHPEEHCPARAASLDLHRLVVLELSYAAAAGVGHEVFLLAEVGHGAGRDLRPSLQFGGLVVGQRHLGVIQVIARLAEGQHRGPLRFRADLRCLAVAELAADQDGISAFPVLLELLLQTGRVARKAVGIFVRQAWQHVGHLLPELPALDAGLAALPQTFFVTPLQPQAAGIQDRGVVGQLLHLLGCQPVTAAHQDGRVEVVGLVINLHELHQRHGLLLALQVGEAVVHRRSVLRRKGVQVVERWALVAAAAGALGVATDHKLTQGV